MLSLGDMLLFEANASQLHLRMLEEVPAALSLSLSLYVIDGIEEGG